MNITRETLCSRAFGFTARGYRYSEADFEITAAREMQKGGTCRRSFPPTKRANILRLNTLYRMRNGTSARTICTRALYNNTKQHISLAVRAFDRVCVRARGFIKYEIYYIKVIQHHFRILFNHF